MRPRASPRYAPALAFALILLAGCGRALAADTSQTIAGLDRKAVADFAQEVKACALGQATAAVLGANVVGARVSEIEMARDAFRAMLKSGGPTPTGRFSDLSMLEPVKDYPPRHASTLLAFEAALEACRAALARAPARTSPAGAD